MAEKVRDQTAVEVIYRYRVAQSARRDFRKAVRLAVDATRMDPPSETQICATLYQPVIGSNPTEWELHLTFASFRDAGRSMDDRSAELAALGDIVLEGVESLEVSNPVMRSWSWPTTESGQDD